MFKDLYFDLLKKYEPHLKKENVRPKAEEKVFVMDFPVIHMCLSIFGGVDAAINSAQTAYLVFTQLETKTPI